MFYDLNIEYFLNRIRSNNHFKYSRYNDGEIISLINKSSNKANCDGHKYFPEMGKELERILLKYKGEDNYILESFDHWYKTLPYVKKKLDEIAKTNPLLKFVRKDFIRHLHEEDPKKFIGLINLLKTKKIVIVGPSYLKRLGKFLEFQYIEIPQKDCYLDIDRIIKKTLGAALKLKNAYFLISGSMPSKIIIDKMPLNGNSYLDWGSVWDTFFVSSRYSFIKKRSTSNKEYYRKVYKEYLL